MPKLIATTDFIDSLFVESDSCKFSSDLLNFLKNDFFGYDLICNLESTDAYKNAMSENPIWELLIDKYDKIEFKQTIKEDIEKKKIDLDDEFCICLVDINENVCDSLQKELGILAISNQNIKKYWECILSIREQLKFKVTSDVQIPNDLRFDCWEKLDFLKLPITSILIFDRYILKDLSNQKLKDNLFIILKKLCSNSELKKKITLTIISDFKSDSEIIESYNKVNAFINNNNLNLKLNLIRHDKKFYPNDFDGLHYRIILSNYFKIKSDDSFNFFKSNGKINNDADLYITFNLSKSNRHFFQKEISDLKRYVNKVKNYDADVALIDKTFYYKDKQNYLFN